MQRLLILIAALGNLRIAKLRSPVSILMIFPDFSEYGYQIERELGQNSAGGRVTYLATEIKTQQPVVIKQFQFARSQSNWTDYEAYQREIQILQQLNHPSIPRYLESFETDTGFCLVQEYKNAPSLAQPRHWTPAEVKQIAIAILEVLIYLQKQTPPIIHRDIKPENILVDRKGKLTIYLVDFGFASFGNKEVAVSSVVKGTLGFMPPEQIFNRQLTTASDLYSLGMTLICLLTRTKSIEIGNLIDETYQIDLKHLLPKINSQFITWLEKAIAPNLKQRYPDASVALAKLLTSKITLSLPTATKVLICLAPIAFFVATIGITTFESVKFSLSFVENITYSKERKQNFRLSNNETLKQQILKNRQCLNCDLSYIDLSETNLAGVDLSNSNLLRANLRNANLASANLSDTNLRGADFSNANLATANLNRANLTNAILPNAKLIIASLRQTNLTGASLNKASLIDADLFRANLTNANLENANLTNTKFQEAKLIDADLRYAKIFNTFFNGTNLTKAAVFYSNGYLGDTKNFENTIMPDGSIYSYRSNPYYYCGYKYE